ncbi:MAG TPA: glutaredoxin domain-containing protein [Polyangiales bacterium]
MRNGPALLVGAVLACGCGNPVGEPAAGAGAAPAVEPPSAAGAPKELVKPPFEVKGELAGLMLSWIDAQGVHLAQALAEIPEASRQHVRVESLATPPDLQLDADHVYVADLRHAGADGSYPVRVATRGWFDGRVDQAKPVPKLDPAQASVVIYKASWCGACKAAAAFLRERHVAFVEKDVEQDQSAQAEMLRKTQAKGLTPRGVPVIDFRGEIMLGFDQPRLESLIAAR